MTEEQQSKTQTEPRQPLGILTCLAAGFEITARHLETLIIPLLLDVFLWLGPRLSLAPLFLGLERWFRQIFTAVTASGTPEAQQMLALLSQSLNELALRYNLFATLSPAPLLGVPALMASRMTLERPFGLRPEMTIASALVALLVEIGLFVVGIGLGALYLRGLGRRVLEETEAPLGGPQTFPRLWGQLLLLTLVILSVGGTLGMAGLAFATLVGVLSVGLALLVLMMSFSLITFTVFHLIFAIPGMTQARRSVFHAIRESILLTRGDFVNATFLILLILVIAQGFNVVWTLPKPATWANLVGIAGHAFISTALTATLFVFYQDRLNFLTTAQQAQAIKEAPAIH